MSRHVIYLHGFASSPGSNKAGFLRERLAARGVHYTVPDLNVPSFERLTLTAMIARVAQEVRRSPADDIYLIGSSMGGLVALHFYDRHREAEAARVRRMVLLAPALDFSANRAQQLGPGWRARWQQAGSLPFYHYGTGREHPVHYGLIEDLDRCDSDAVTVDIPVRIYHGRGDESVPYQGSVRFAQARPAVSLVLLASDHQLLDQRETILQGVVDFFGL